MPLCTNCSCGATRKTSSPNAAAICGCGCSNEGIEMPKPIGPVVLIECIGKRAPAIGCWVSVMSGEAACLYMGVSAGVKTAPGPVGAFM